MQLSAIWRYPVKSLAGEPLSSAALQSTGIEGDRIVQVRNTRGKILTARAYPRLLGLKATLDAGGEPLVDGRRWTDPAVAAAIEAAAGEGCSLALDRGPGRFDILPLLVATDGALEAMGEDPRRFRPNLVIASVPGLAERAWEGRLIRVGAALIRAVDLRERCVMTTYHPDTQAQNPAILRRIYGDFGGVLGLNCLVVRPAVISAGDPVTLVAEDSESESLR